MTCRLDEIHFVICLVMYRIPHRLQCTAFLSGGWPDHQVTMRFVNFCDASCQASGTNNYSLHLFYDDDHDDDDVFTASLLRCGDVCVDFLWPFIKREKKERRLFVGSKVARRALEFLLTIFKTIAESS